MRDKSSPVTEHTPRARLARPVWDPQVWQLLEQSDDITKGWLLELVERRPLARAESLLVGRLATSGPQLCDALVRALGSHQDLTVLQPGGAMATTLVELGAFVDAHGPFELSAALELLRGVVSNTLRAALANPDPELIWALGERLSLVFEIARGTALSGAEALAASGAPVAAHAPHPPDAGLEPEPRADDDLHDPGGYRAPGSFDAEDVSVSVERRAVTSSRRDEETRFAEAERERADELRRSDA